MCCAVVFHLQRYNSINVHTFALYIYGNKNGNGFWSISFLIFKRKYSSLTINRISEMHFSNGKRNGVIWCNHKWNDTFAKSHQFNTSSLLNVSHQTFAQGMATLLIHDELHYTLCVVKGIDYSIDRYYMHLMYFFLAKISLNLYNAICL